MNNGIDFYFGGVSNYWWPVLQTSTYLANCTKLPKRYVSRESANSRTGGLMGLNWYPQPLMRERNVGDLCEAQLGSQKIYDWLYNICQGRQKFLNWLFSDNDMHHVCFLTAALCKWVWPRLTPTVSHNVLHVQGSTHTCLSCLYMSVCPLILHVHHLYIHTFSAVVSRGVVDSAVAKQSPQSQVFDTLGHHF